MITLNENYKIYLCKFQHKVINNVDMKYLYVSVFISVTDFLMQFELYFCSLYTNVVVGLKMSKEFLS